MAAYTNCQSITRRDCLQLGLGGFLGAGLVDVLRARGRRGRAQPPAASCILVWMDGGPTHYETFDPKPDAPSEIRGEFEPIETKTPGVFFSKHMTSAGRDRRQAGDRPLDPPRPGQSRRRQSLHDDRRARRAFPSAAARSSASIPASARSSPTSVERPERLARLLLDPPDVALRRAELSGRQVRPVRRARRPQPRPTSASATSPCPAASNRPLRRPPRAARARSTACSASTTRPPPIRSGPRRILPAGLRPDH